MKKCLIGIISWCDSERFPQRFKAFQKCLKSWEKYISKDSCTIAIVDNNSSESVQKLIETSPLFDIKVILPENIHDVGAYGVLSQIAKDQGLDYVWFLENDYELFRPVKINSLITFLKKHPKCGYIRMQKFEVAYREKYDKNLKQKKNTDLANAIWLRNIVTSEALKVSEPHSILDDKYYLTNWHFGIHGGFMKTKTWDHIFPPLTSQVPYYYKFEKYMREKYQQGGYKTGFLDGGAFSMIAPTVYQSANKSTWVNQIKELVSGHYGGFIDGKIISYYQENYKNYAPMEIQLFSNSLGVEELKGLKEVFDSKWLGYGAKSKQFEAVFAQMLGVKYALGISSCTAGLFMSMELLGVGKGDEVIMPSIGFIGAANAVVNVGAKPIFVDVHPRTLNVMPSEIAKAITAKTKAVILLHYGGVPAQMNEISQILKKQKNKIYLIEDSANSIKSKYRGKYCGSFGDIGLFSLDANKVITTGTGGIFTTNNDDLYYKARVFRFYGLKPSLASGYDAMRVRRERWWEIDLEYHGNRYIINDIVSVIALAQLKKLDSHILDRKKIWTFYNQKLKGIKHITLPPPLPDYISSSYYFYWIQVESDSQQLSLAKHLVNMGIYTTFRYYPLHLVPYYKKSRTHLPHSEKIARTTLNLPFHQNLTKRDAERVVSAVINWSRAQV